MANSTFLRILPILLLLLGVSLTVVVDTKATATATAATKPERRPRFEVAVDAEGSMFEIGAESRMACDDTCGAAAVHDDVRLEITFPRNATVITPRLDLDFNIDVVAAWEVRMGTAFDTLCGVGGRVIVQLNENPDFVAFDLCDGFGLSERTNGVDGSRQTFTIKHEPGMQVLTLRAVALSERNPPMVCCESLATAVAAYNFGWDDYVGADRSRTLFYNSEPTALMQRAEAMKALPHPIEEAMASERAARAILQRWGGPTRISALRRLPHKEFWEQGVESVLDAHFHDAAPAIQQSNAGRGGGAGEEEEYFLFYRRPMGGITSQLREIVQVAAIAFVLDRTLVLPDLSSTWGDSTLRNHLHDEPQQRMSTTFQTVFDLEYFQASLAGALRVATSGEVPVFIRENVERCFGLDMQLCSNDNSTVKLPHGFEAPLGWYEREYGRSSGYRVAAAALAIVLERPPGCSYFPVQFVGPRAKSIERRVRTSLRFHPAVRELARIAVSRLRSLIAPSTSSPSAAILAVHMRVEPDWLPHCRSIERRCGQACDACTGATEIVARINAHPQVGAMRALIYVAVSERDLPDGSESQMVLRAWRNELREAGGQIVTRGDLLADDESDTEIAHAVSQLSSAMPSGERTLLLSELPYLINSAIDFEICSAHAAAFVANSWSSFGADVSRRLSEKGRPAFIYNVRNASAVVLRTDGGTMWEPSDVTMPLGVSAAARSSDSHAEAARDEEKKHAAPTRADDGAARSSLALWFDGLQREDASSVSRPSPAVTMGNQCDARSDATPRPLLAVGVKTSPDAFAARQALRETWFEFIDARVYLRFAVPPPRTADDEALLAEMLAAEQAAFGDLLLDLPFDRLTGVAGLADHDQLAVATAFMAHAVDSCDFEFLMLVNDDVYVRLDSVVAALKHPSSSSERLYAGRVPEDDDDHFRRPAWITTDQWSLAEFPPFAVASHYILSHDCAEFIAQNAGRLQAIGAIEDVTIASWLLPLRVKAMPIQPFASMQQSECADSFASFADITPDGVRLLHRHNIRPDTSICEGFDRAALTKRGGYRTPAAAYRDKPWADDDHHEEVHVYASAADTDASDDQGGVGKGRNELSAASRRDESCLGSATFDTVPDAARDRPGSPFLRTLADRWELPNLLNELELFGRGVELGVHRGDFSRHLLDVWRGEYLFMVDAWEPDNIYQASDRSADYAHAARAVSEHANRSQLVRAFTSDAVHSFSDQFFDWIYVDASHDYGNCLHDIQTWWPKLRRGGLMAGDDYHNGFVASAGSTFGCKDAVDEFAGLHGLRVYVTNNWQHDQTKVRQVRVGSIGTPPNWYILKC